MLGQVVLDDDVPLLGDIRAVGLHHQKFALTELSFAGAVVEAGHVVGVVSYLEAFLQSFGHLHGSGEEEGYLGFRTPVMMKGELLEISPSMYSLTLSMGIPEFWFQVRSTLEKRVNPNCKVPAMAINLSAGSRLAMIFIVDVLSSSIILVLTTSREFPYNS